MVDTLNKIGNWFIEGIFKPCFGAENWLAWTTFSCICCFILLVVVIIVLAVKYKDSKADNVSLEATLEAEEEIIKSKASQITKLTENIAAKEGQIKTLTDTNSELDTKLISQKDSYEKEISLLKDKNSLLKNEIKVLKASISVEATQPIVEEESPKLEVKTKKTSSKKSKKKSEDTKEEKENA